MKRWFKMPCMPAVSPAMRTSKYLSLPNPHRKIKPIIQDLETPASHAEIWGIIKNLLPDQWHLDLQEPLPPGHYVTCSRFDKYRILHSETDWPKKTDLKLLIVGFSTQGENWVSLIKHIEVCHTGLVIQIFTGSRLYMLIGLPEHESLVYLQTKPSRLLCLKKVSNIKLERTQKKQRSCKIKRKNLLLKWILL